MSYTWLVESREHVPSGASTIGDVVELDMSVLAPGRKVSAVRIREAMVPNIAYSVTRSNRTFLISIGASDYYITIPVGYYTRDSLILAINTEMNTVLGGAGHTGVLNYDPTSYTVELVVDGGVVYSLNVPVILFSDFIFNITITDGLPPVPTVYTVTVPAGTYLHDSYVTAVNAALMIVFGESGYTVTFDYDEITLECTLSVQNGLGDVPYTLDKALLPYKDAPTLINMLGFDDRTLPYIKDSKPIGPVNPDPDRFMMITCDQARGLRGQVESLSYQVIPLPTASLFPWHNGIVATFPLALPKGQVSKYDPGDQAQWVHLTRSEINGKLTFRLVRDRFEVFGPSAIYWSMLLEVWLA